MTPRVLAPLLALALAPGGFADDAEALSPGHAGSRASHQAAAAQPEQPGTETPLSLEALDAVMAEDGDPQAGAGPQDGEPPSLEDLDALMAEDEEGGAGDGLTRADLVDVVGLSLVLGVALVSFFRKSRALKYGAMALSVGYLGFYKANLVSIVNVFSLLDGSLPDLAISVPWYVLIGFTIASTVMWGRVYCGRICAFGALTQLLDRVVPARLRYDPPAWFDRRAVYVKYGLLVGAIAYFLATRDFLVYRYIEPFWMFTLNGNVVMWTLLGVLLLATVFVRNLYCRYLCSVGAALGVMSHLTVFRIKRWGECNTCKICEKACDWGAIDGPRISVTECVRCDDCERIYHDQDTCVHWIVLRRARPSRAGAKA